MTTSPSSSAVPALILAINHFVLTSRREEDINIVVGDDRRLFLSFRRISLHPCLGEDVARLEERLCAIAPALTRLGIQVMFGTLKGSGRNELHEIQLTVPDGANQVLCVAGLLMSERYGRTWGSGKIALETVIMFDPWLTATVAQAKETLIRYLPDPIKPQ